MSMIRAHIASEPDVLHQLMSSLFNTLLLTSHANHWAVTRPILSLMLASEASFAGTFVGSCALLRSAAEAVCCLVEILDPIPSLYPHLTLSNFIMKNLACRLSD